MFQRTTVYMEHILKTAILQGVRLLKPHLENIMESESIPYPTEGGGVKGRILVSDLARAIVQHVLPDAGKDLQESLIKKICKQPSQANGEDDVSDDDLPEDLLRVLAHMDLENKEQFKEVSERAAHLLQAKAKEAAQSKIRRRVRAVEEDMQKKLDAAKNPQEKSEQPEKSAASAKATIRAPHEKIRAPEELLELLPPGISHCYIQVRFKQRIASVEFKRGWVKMDETWLDSSY